jgi:hypothetical protein
MATPRNDRVASTCSGARRLGDPPRSLLGSRLPRRIRVRRVRSPPSGRVKRAPHECNRRGVTAPSRRHHATPSVLLGRPHHTAASSSLARYGAMTQQQRDAAGDDEQDDSGRRDDHASPGWRGRSSRSPGLAQSWHGPWRTEPRPARRGELPSGRPSSTEAGTGPRRPGSPSPSRSPAHRRPAARRPSGPRPPDGGRPGSETTVCRADGRRSPGNMASIRADGDAPISAASTSRNDS